jgi:hypothetical protein
VSEHPPTDPIYEEQLEARLLHVLKTGPASFRLLAERAEGAYPTDVLAALRKLERAGTLAEGQNKLWMRTDSTSQTTLANDGADESLVHWDDSDFPEPHPLDFDWRFGRRTLELLDQRIAELDCTTVAVLGAPTLFKFLVDHTKTAHLFDRNEQIVRYLTRIGYKGVTRCDLFRFSPREQFSCVVADPPWYLDHYRAFIEGARRLLVPKGKLLLSILPRLTRPYAEQDRSEILRFASDRGFDLVRTEFASLQYLSPPFEKEALKSEGLSVSSWRSGDLYTFVMTQRLVPEYRLDYSEEHQLWRTWNVGRSVVKVKWDGTHGRGSFDFQSVSAAGGVRLRSVSRRSPLRSRINLWTSRNIALHVSRPDVVCAALELHLEGHHADYIAMALMNAEQLSDREVERLKDLLRILADESKRLET